MRELSPADLLTAWEQGMNRSESERALILLAATLPGVSPAAVGRMPLGWRDAALLTLRERVFGSRLVSRAACPTCGESLEMEFNAAEIRVATPTGSPPVESQLELLVEQGEGPQIEMELDGYALRFRLVNSLDMHAAGQMENAQAAQAVLFRRCVLEARRNSSPVEPDSLPEVVRAAVARRIAECDPQADVRLSLTCLSCGKAWQAPFEIDTFFWEELQAWAKRMLRDIHLLARVYGWHEADILALSPARRQAYLDMVEE